MAKTTARAASFLDKGGTGKTTTTGHFAAALAQNHDVLAIDLAGKQGDLGFLFGLQDEIDADLQSEGDWPNISTVFDERWGDIADRLGSPRDAVNELVYESPVGVDVIPAHPGLDSLDGDLRNIDDPTTRYTRLREFLNEYVDPLGYDAVLIDLPGSTNNIALNGIWAAEAVFAPVKLGPFEFKQAKSVRSDLAGIRENYTQANPQLSMLVPNLYTERTKLDSEKLADFESEFGGVVAPEPVKESQQIMNLTDNGETLFQLPAEELSTTGRQARNAFQTNAEALLQRIQQ